jgi:undecaprenyl-diphosphatase
VASHELSVLEAIGGALLQGVAIVYPISGLGHGVLIGSLKHGAGADLAPVNAQYLYAALHVGVAAALIVHYWRDWLRIVRGLLGAVARPLSSAPERRWAWLMVLAAAPGCIAVALLAPHARGLLHHPRLAAACLAGNGALMLAVWWWWRRSPRAGGMSGTHRARLTRGEQAEAFASELSSLRTDRAFVLGLLPLGALVPGVSGVALTLSVALIWGLTHEQSVHIALLLVTPMLLTWGLTELPDLSAAQYDGVRTNTLVAVAIAAVTAYLTAALLVRYFRRASLRPFGYYCLLAGGVSLILLAA